MTKEQQDFLNAEGNVVLCACPGSGKTYVVANKLLKYLRSWNKPHQGVAVLSFTNVASQEIERQVSKLMPNSFDIDYPHYVGTIDSFINSYILLRFGYLLNPSRQRLVIAMNDLFTLPFGYWRRECHINGCVENIHEFRWDINGRLRRNKDVVTCTGGPHGLPCSQYKKMLFQKGFVFQSEVAGLSYTLLRGHPQIARSIASRFPVIIVDEAQDTSIEQVAVMDLINAAGTESMFFVGDPDQSIYEWRDAAPECFLGKMGNPQWATLSLTTNFRSSQLICNATQAFSSILADKEPSRAGGESAEYKQKPILMVYDGDISVARTTLVKRYTCLCEERQIEICPENVAIVTRGKIFNETSITGLWKSKEIELFARAAYEWLEGSRKRAYELCEKAIFSLVIKELCDINISLENEVEQIMPYEAWRCIVLDLLVKIPFATTPISEWVVSMAAILDSSLVAHQQVIHDGRSVSDVVKIKSRDKKSPNFLNIPLGLFFETRSHDGFTVSSIHGVKGETFDALMLVVEDKGGSSLTPSFIDNGNLNLELMRIAYVAITRPRKLLVVAIPKVASRKTYKRFPQEKWDYIEVHS